MADKRYRYKSATVDAKAMALVVPPPYAIVGGTPCVLCVDIVIDEDSKVDLDSFMETQKYTYVEEVAISDPPYLPLIMTAVNSGVPYNLVIDDSSGTAEIVITPA